ncbi:MAG: MtrB/PioB family decaheme-associated outer membrane protein [Rubrivivax sp.]|nr:MtrB/PioB family decaheme-associated outer membrane protein [Rubrivivax sp.]
MNAILPLKILAACGVLSAAASAAAADPSQWKCESCPYPKAGLSGEVEAGVGLVTGERPGYGDYTGLNDKKSFVVLGGTLRQRSDEGYAADVTATNLGLNARRIDAAVGQQGRWGLSLGLAETPHRIAGAGRTPFIGVGGSVLTLPAGYPAVSSSAMPASTLNSVDLGVDRKRTDLGATFQAGPGWSTSLKFRRDVREGTQRLGASFYSTSSLLAAPVDQSTDQIEAAVAYASRTVQASLAYHASTFRNNADSVTWANPFQPVVAGSTRGQMALAPDNEFHQVSASGGFELAPKMRLSGDVSVGRGTQDSAFVAATLNPSLVTAALPAAALNGKVDTFDARVALTAQPAAGLRVNASVARSERDNRTPALLAWPAVAADLFVSPTARRNPAYSVKSTRLKLNADWRLTKAVTLAGGYDGEERIRSYLAATTTSEDTFWLKARATVFDGVGLSLRLAHADRTASPYGAVTYGPAPQNPLLRLPFLSNRSRNTVGARVDWAIGENLNVAVHFDAFDDDYTQSALGLQAARGASGGVEVGWTLSEQTQLYVFAHDEQGRAFQRGSEAFAGADWQGRILDSAQVAGAGVRHVALGGKLELAGDVVFARSREQTQVNSLQLPTPAAAPFPMASNMRDSFKLTATWKMSETMSLTGRYAYEDQHVADWRWDGINPGTVGNLLALGETPPTYRVNVLSVALRYRF